MRLTRGQLRRLIESVVEEAPTKKTRNPLDGLMHMVAEYAVDQRAKDGNDADPADADWDLEELADAVRPASWREIRKAYRTMVSKKGTMLVDAAATKQAREEGDTSLTPWFAEALVAAIDHANDTWVEDDAEDDDEEDDDGEAYVWPGTKLMAKGGPDAEKFKRLNDEKNALVIDDKLNPGWELEFRELVDEMEKLVYKNGFGLFVDRPPDQRGWKPPTK